MFGLSLPHLLIAGIIVLVLFGKGRISDVMGEVAKGIKSFKKGMADEDAPATAAQAAPPRINQSPVIDAQAEPAKQDAKA